MRRIEPRFDLFQPDARILKDGNEPLEGVDGAGDLVDWVVDML